MKKTFGLAAAAVLTLALSACGDDDSGGFDEAAYCDAYTSAQSELEGSDFSQLDAQTFNDLEDKVADLGEKAPDELKGDWETFESALTDFETILDDAGLSIDDLSDLQSGQIPEGVDPEKLRELGTEMQDFAQSSDIQDASDAIQEDAQTRCDVPAEGGES